MIDKNSVSEIFGWDYYHPLEKASNSMLTTPEYSDWVEGMIITSGQTRMIENTLGLVGEAGEFAEKVKKVIRDGTFDRELILKELGDVVFYAAALANYFGSDLQEVIDINVTKLEDRKARNKLQGSGDDR